MTIYHTKPGQQFGQLCVLEEVGRDRWGHMRVKCECKGCGNIFECRRSDLVRGHTTACGCNRRYYFGSNGGARND